MSVTIGLQLPPQHGEMARMREAWLEAEALGVDRIWTADHFLAQQVSQKDYAAGQIVTAKGGKNFEATTVLAAMAATTQRVEIGSMVLAVGFRNPNLVADMARTIDHISGGRFILGLGAGYLKEDYEEYGYPYGTQKSRLLDLAAAIPVIKSRFQKLNPKPLRKIPLLVASMGGQIGMRIVAEHADLWNVLGTTEKVREKCELLRQYCTEFGRRFEDIETTTFCIPQLNPDVDPDVLYGELGFRHIIAFAEGPDWDLGPLKELLAWRKGLAVR
ncbi:MAG: LLM class F420-dependent oxidoreductase [Sterolibacterium sp.]|nr:LLM class F420-dependent oxidoreductase [Sterolibacterium sp.]